jgi:hypothetical protein
MKTPEELSAEEAAFRARIAKKSPPDHWVHIVDELEAIVQRARGIEAAIEGSIEVPYRETIKGVHALYLDHLGSLIRFKERFEESWNERGRPA